MGFFSSLLGSTDDSCNDCIYYMGVDYEESGEHSDFCIKKDQELDSMETCEDYDDGEKDTH